MASFIQGSEEFIQLSAVRDWIEGVIFRIRSVPSMDKTDDSLMREALISTKTARNINDANK